MGETVSFWYIRRKYPFLTEKLIKLQTILMDFSQDVVYTIAIDLTLRRFKKLGARKHAGKASDQIGLRVASL